MTATTLFLAYYSGGIHPRKVTRCNDQSIWIGGKRFPRFTQSEGYYNTHAEAVAAVRKALENNVARKRDMLEYAESNLADFLARYVVNTESLTA